MSKPHSWSILLNSDSWQIAFRRADRFEVSDAFPLGFDDVSQLAQEIHAALDRHGYRSKGVLMGLTSCWCLNAQVQPPSARVARNRLSMAYLAEPFIPWSAEETVIDYEQSSGSAFVVAVKVEPLRCLINELELLGVTIESVAPLARLTLARMMAQQKLANAERLLILWQDQGHIELWLLKRGRPSLWRTLVCDGHEVVSSVEQITLLENAPIPVAVSFLPEELTECLRRNGHFEVYELDSESSSKPQVAALLQATDILKGRQTNPLEFRRDSLAAADRQRSIRKQLIFLQSAAVILLATLGYFLFEGAQQYESVRVSFEERQTEAFRRLYPGQRIPVGIRSRLQTELSQLQGARDAHAPLPGSTDAMAVVHDFLQSLPTGLRFRILEIRVQDGELYLVGQARTHGDADRLASGLRERGFTVASPTTHQLDSKSIEFRISGKSVTSEQQDASS